MCAALLCGHSARTRAHCRAAGCPARLGPSPGIEIAPGTCRRACGEYVLATNPDAWLSEGFWQLVAARGLQPRFYYRMGRIDTGGVLPRDSLSW